MPNVAQSSGKIVRKNKNEKSKNEKTKMRFRFFSQTLPLFRVVLSTI